MSHCLAAVKASMLVIQRSQEMITTALVKTPDTIQCALSDLLECYTRILTNGETKTLLTLLLISEC